MRPRGAHRRGPTWGSLVESSAGVPRGGARVGVTRAGSQRRVLFGVPPWDVPRGGPLSGFFVGVPCSVSPLGGPMQGFPAGGPM
jgi:hypothetical protein